MPAKAALVDYDVCRPAECPEGLCRAAAACRRRLLRQEAPYEIPMPDPSLCRACGDCVRACSRRAVRIVNG